MFHAEEYRIVTGPHPKSSLDRDRHHAAK